MHSYIMIVHVLQMKVLDRAGSKLTMQVKMFYGKLSQYQFINNN